MSKDLQVFKNVTVDKVESIKELISGLDRTEWNYIKNSVDMYFSEKAAKVKIDDLELMDRYLKRKY